MDLHQVDRDIFTGWCHSGSPLRAYGGQIAAQSLMAAGRTVDDAARRIHSLHGYFLRPGHTKESITYLVDRPRDGGSFSTRFVRAVQNGETIFMMTASFAMDDDGPVHQFSPPADVVPPEVANVPIPLPEHLNGADPMELDYPDSHIIGLRMVGADEAVERVDGRYERMAWVRIEEPLPDDPLIQACALTYLSDLTMVSTALAPHSAGVERAERPDHRQPGGVERAERPDHRQPGGVERAERPDSRDTGALSRPDLMLASIDHAMWFNEPTRADQWLLFAQDTPVAGHGHGLARGLFFDAEGAMVASVVQESLMRTRRR